MDSRTSFVPTPAPRRASLPLLQIACHALAGVVLGVLFHLLR